MITYDEQGYVEPRSVYIQLKAVETLEGLLAPRPALLPARPGAPQQAAKTVRVRVPKHQAVSRRAIAKMRGLKQEILNPPMRLISCD